MNQSGSEWSWEVSVSTSKSQLASKSQQLDQDGETLRTTVRLQLRERVVLLIVHRGVLMMLPRS